MSKETNAKMLERVRALLAKADSSEFPGEADAFRKKADDLMTQYTIEQWQIDAATQGANKRPEPEHRKYDISWYGQNPHRDYLWMLMQDVALHCRIVLVYWRYGGDSIPIVGLPSDIDYFDMLFTHLMLQMGANLEPKPDPEAPIIENLVRLKESGMKWERIGELLINIGQLETYNRNVGVRFTGLYSRYCKDTGREQLRTSPAVYQRSYAIGFVNEVRARFKEMDQNKEKKGTGMELALRDIREVVAKAAIMEFGAPRQTGKAVSKNYRRDEAAYRQGVVAGRRADISSSAGSRLGSTRKQIGG
jgi:Protein of unknown function (DUF2786)